MHHPPATKNLLPELVDELYQASNSSTGVRPTILKRFFYRICLVAISPPPKNSLREDVRSWRQGWAVVWAKRLYVRDWRYMSWIGPGDVLITSTRLTNDEIICRKLNRCQKAIGEWSVPHVFDVLHGGQDSTSSAHGDLGNQKRPIQKTLWAGPSTQARWVIQEWAAPEKSCTLTEPWPAGTFGCLSLK
jgi:hypothetical protein